MLAKLNAFYCCESITESKETDSPNLLADQILFIRKCISSQAAIIIFDGYSAAQNCYPHLHRLIHDDALEILSHLVQPWLGDSKQTIDIENFRKTYFLILADGKLDFLKPYTHEKSWKLEAPCWKDKDKVIATIFKTICANLQSNEENLKPLSVLRDISVPQYIIKSIDSLNRLPRESVIAATYCLLLMRDKFNTVLPDNWEEEMSHLYSDDIESFFKQFVTFVKNNLSAEQLLIVRFIAISNSGIRKDTLLRCMDLWSKATSTHRLPDHLHINKKNISEKTINDLIKTHPLTPLFIERNDELIAPLGKLADHPFEYPDIADVLSEPVINDIDKSIDVRYHDIRNAIIRDIEEDEPFCKYLLHRLISEEALRQFIIIRRHSKAPDNLHLRIYRRGLEALLHGFFPFHLNMILL